MLVDTPEARQRAFRFLRLKRLDEAQRAYKMLLSASPKDADLIGRLAEVALLQERRADAEDLLRRSLRLNSGPRVRLRNLFNLAMLLHKCGRDGEVLPLVAAEAPEWPEGTSAGEGWRQMVLWLVDALIAVRATDKARRVLDRALPHRSDDADALALEGWLTLREGDADRALRIVRKLDRLGAEEIARKQARHIMRNWSGYVDPPRPSHEGTILVCSPSATTTTNLPEQLRDLHFRANFAGQIACRMQHQYRFISVFSDLLETEFHKQLPQADLVLNNCVNAERLERNRAVDSLRKQVEATGLPVINHPDHVMQCSRDNVGQLLAGIPNLKVPRIKRYRSDILPIDEVVSDIGENFGYPLIIRKPYAQASSGSLFLNDEKKTVVLIPNAAALRDFLTRTGWIDFYAIEYVDLKRTDGLFRKIRAMAIGKEILIQSASFYDQWLVGGWRIGERAEKFYEAHPGCIEEGARIITNAAGALGPGPLAALRRLRERIPLDVFGVDFDVNGEGRTVVFEVSPAMIFWPVGPIPEKLQPLSVTPELITTAFESLFRQRLSSERSPRT